MVDLKKIFSYIRSCYTDNSLFSRILCNARNVDDTKRKRAESRIIALNNKYFARAREFSARYNRAFLHATELFKIPVRLQKKIAYKCAE